MIVARNLTRKYGDFTAVDDVSFSIGDGEIVGLLGHNGAGKTTIMKMLTGYLEPTSGDISVGGFDIERDLTSAQRLIGYLPENCPVYPEMTVVDYLDYAAELRGVGAPERATALKRAIRATELQEKATELISTLSRGYRQRVGVAQAILHKPKIVILDEPTNGLDPSQIKHMRSLITDLSKSATVIISTHILQEVQAICDRVLIVNRGRLSLDKPMAELQGEQRLRLVTNAAQADVADTISRFDDIARLEPVGSKGTASSSYLLHLSGSSPDAIAPKVARAVMENGHDLIALHTDERDLETIFAEMNVASNSAHQKEAGHGDA